MTDRKTVLHDPRLADIILERHILRSQMVELAALGFVVFWLAFAIAARM